MSWFSSAAAPAGPNIHPVQLAFEQEALFGPLVKEDTEWLCAGGFITETQVWYATTKTGGLVMCQVIHSSVGVWYPSIQFTFRYVEPSQSKHIWKSTTVTNFVVGPPSTKGPALDKRSCKSDQFTITVDPAHPKVYKIEGKYDDQVQISLVYEQLAEGWKLGAGPRGGMTYFGAANSSAGKTVPDVTGGADGYAVHRFWPRCAISGIVRIGNEVVDLEGARGVFIHAIQGLRPNVLAAKWNFANFQSPADEGIALTMMEFTTTPAYGSKKINIGSVVVGDKLVAVTAGGNGIDGKSVAEHLDTTIDVETDYPAPGKINYIWEGVSLSVKGHTPLKSAPATKANLLLDLITSKEGEPYATKGLVEKVDVLGQIPYLVKKFVNYAAGTKPFIYTWLNDAKATVTYQTDSDTPETKTVEVSGVIFNEATFIS